MSAFPSFPNCALALVLALVGAGRLLAEQPGKPAAPSAETGASSDSGAKFDADGMEFFEKRVRPLLAARCQSCHGALKQKGNLRLDSRAGALKGGDTSPAIVPGKPEESLLVDAIRYGETYQMPPKSQMPAEEIATLVEWIRIGAPWGREAAEQASDEKTFDLKARAGHWSFQPLANVHPPKVAKAGWVKTPMDAFILAGLEAQGLAPAAAADKRTLLRRVTYDLTGLPPTPQEIEAFLADRSPQAYQKVVDRLLDSPRYGERWARHWLDLVRFSETYGHEFDFEIPNAYRYRDYLIRALNNDLPFDQFVIEHVAGDLLDRPRRNPEEGYNESIIATGAYFFGEAKHSPVDVRQDQADRIDNQIDVFGKAFLGLTISCARCHDHKFDPISTKDYYALAGYLRSSRYQQAFIDAAEPLAGQTAQLSKLNDERAAKYDQFSRAVLEGRTGLLAEAMIAGLRGEFGEDWNKYLADRALPQTDDVLHAWARLTKSSSPAAAAEFPQFVRGVKTAPAPSAASFKTFAEFSGPDFGDWRATGAAFGDAPARAWDWSFVEASGLVRGRILPAGAAHSGRISSKLRGALRSPTFTIEKPRIHYRLFGTGGNVRLVVDGLQIIRAPIYGGLMFGPGGATPHWVDQDVSKWIGQRAYIELIDEDDHYLALEKVVFAEGPPQPATVNGLVAKMLEPKATTPAALAQHFKLLFKNVFSAWLADPRAPGADAADRAAIVNWVLDHMTSPEAGNPDGEFSRQFAELDQRQQQLEGQLTPPRQALAIADGTGENEHVFVRGNYKTQGDEVQRRFLEVFGAATAPAAEPGSGRLELAQQLVANPLLPRVIVNRLWHHHFGAGLVRSPDDFGIMGQKPTHPELLDYLAGELIREGWSLKHLHRTLLLSNTYQMASQPTPGDSVDPQNKLWHRMSVRRLEGEAIRDAMLAVSGRMDGKMYGPGVMPFLTPYMTGKGRPEASGPLDGDGRRSVYLAVRRNFLAPLFLAFDYPTPFTTIGRRSVSNVPAQALVMMNNPLVTEQSRLWADRVLAGPDRPLADRVNAMYLTAFGRPADSQEQQVALDFLGQANHAATPSERQLWTDYAHVLFNVKEFIFIQ